MKYAIRIIILFSILNVFSGQTVAESVGKVSSPDGRLSATVHLGDRGEAFYEVLLDGESLLEWSRLGLDLADATLAYKLSFASATEPKAGTEAYELIVGKNREINEVYNESLFTFTSDAGLELGVRFRVFNDGLGFRYEVSGERENAVIVHEYTAFDVAGEGNAWMQPYDIVTQWAPAYEAFYSDEIGIGTPAPQEKNGWAFPMLFNTGGKWMLISDAGLYEDYVGVHLEANCEDGLYQVKLPEPDEARGLCGNAAWVSLPWQSPWRVVIASDNVADVVESNLITNFAEPSEVEETDWIKPGLASWSWWSLSESPTDYGVLKEFVDYSAEMGWAYSLVDANWNNMEGGDLEQLSAYALEQGVGLLVWYNSGGRINVVTEQPRDIMIDDAARKKEFAWLHEIGVKGIKVDFFQSDKQCIIQLYMDILRDAAEHELLVNFHGCTLPRGWNRTFPHQVTMESVMGGEVYKFNSSFAQKAPALNTIYAFTRNVVGSMDYTPVTFMHHNAPHFTSNAHELALGVVFESGITHMADHIDSYRAQPDYVIEFMKGLPAQWDEVKYLSGHPGDEVVLARRNGEKWYIGGISGEYSEKTLEVDLSFLDGAYDLTLIKDGRFHHEFELETMGEVPSEPLQVDLLRNGGFVILAEPK